VVDGGLMVWASEMTLCCGKGDRAHERKIERGQAGAGGGGVAEKERGTGKGQGQGHGHGHGERER
jgi:hypothetical protein